MATVRSLPLAVLAAGLLLATSPSAARAAEPAPAGLAPASADLDAAQVQLLNEARSHLKNAITNFNVAQGGLPRSGTISKSKAKLALVRLASAKAPLPEIEKRLAQLPADDPNVAETRKNYEAVKKAITDLETLLNGGNAPPEAPQQGTKLDYRQEKALSDVRFFLNEITGRAQSVARIADQVAQVPDHETLDHRVVAQAMNTIVDARRKVGNANDRFLELPEDGTGVPEAARALAEQVASLDRSEAILTPAHATLTRLIDPASHPELQADLERVRELSGMFYDTQVLQLDRPRAARIVGQADAALAEVQRIAGKYERFINQQTEPGRNLSGAAGAFLENYNGFAQAVEAERQGLPARMDGEMAGVTELMEQAVSERKPLFFTGGCAQQMAFLEDELALYRVIAPEQAPAYDAKLAALETRLREAELSLVDEIIASNRMPPDAFQAADRDRCIELAREALEEQLPGAEVLAVAIPSQDWKREVMWRNQTGTWYKVDRSKVQVQLIVRRDDRIAEVRPFNLWKNHLEGDTVRAFPFYGDEDEIGPQSLLLVENVR